MWFVNAHVVDAATGDRLRHRAVETAADGTVAQVAAAAPPGLPDADVVDVAGRWLLPGLISCHTHLSIVFPFSDTDEAENPAVTAYRSATRASEALRAGITTIRCVHEQNRADLLLRTAVRRGWFAAPRILGAGRAISTPGGHGQGGACAYATGEQEFYARGAGRTRRGRRPREDLHQRRPGRRGRALRAARDDRRRDPRGGPGGRRARHLRRRPLRRAGRDPAGAGRGRAVLRARLPARRRDRRAAGPAGHLPHAHPVRDPLGDLDAGPGLRGALDPERQQRRGRPPGQHPARDPGGRHPRQRHRLSRPATWSTGPRPRCTSCC